MRELSLFSGAGGGLLATKYLLGWEAIGYVEFNDYCQRILAQRIKDGHLDNAPIYGDIRTFNNSGCAELYRGITDIITAGFPCQPYSNAARGRNKAGYGLDTTMHTVSIIRPPNVYLENVKRQPIEEAGKRLHEMGYTIAATPLASSDLGADHIRRRYWLLAYADDKSELLRSINAKMGKLPKLSTSVWASNPRIPRVANGMAHRMDRFKATGNGQCPIVAAKAWELLS